MKTRILRNALILGLISAIGPFAIDMYLPALPSIGRSLGAGAGAVQMSLSVFFIALSLGQPICGPLSDRFGRKAPLYVGLCVFAAATLGCALAPNVTTLIVFRFLQGVGACPGLVIPRAVVRDLHTGLDATRLMSLLMLVFSVSPILAPLTGSFVIEFAGWRGVFWTVLAASIVGLGISTLLAETRARAARAASSLAGALGAYRRLLRDRAFLGLTFVAAFGLSSFFVYLANSPFVLIEHYHLSPRLYSLLFSLNAASFFATAQLNGWLAQRIGLKRLVRRAATGFALVMLALLALFALGVDRLTVLVAMLFAGFGCLGMLLPTATVLALEEHGSIAGTASAFMGTVQFATGSAVMLLVGALASSSPVPMLAGIAVCALLALALERATDRAPHPLLRATSGG
ncbi:MAG TPA: multidrug effflux MFS transporter [Steroidobacteraceae bacterium]|nr:multidrug effflux MFS transporter [Steroidobacteraceae bacterium]